MDKLTVGQKIRELREHNELSQYQLGKLVGLKGGKGVSKWETGKAIPERTVIDKLSGILGFDFDTMINDNLTPDEAEAYVSAQREKLWDEADRRMKEIYGEEPPLAITNRFILEKNSMRHSNAIILLDALGKVQSLAREKRKYFSIRGAECFTGWLLGATRVNPLEPHRYCPKCHRVEFHPEVRSGWDLPAGICECGYRMTNDGQDIPAEIGIVSEKSPYEFYWCNTDKEFLPEAEKAILNYGEQFFTMERYHEDAEETFITDPETGAEVTDPETGKKIPLWYVPQSALMFRPKKKAKVRKPEKISGPTELTNWGRHAGEPTIFLMGGFNGTDSIHRLPVFPAAPEELTQPEILERGLRDWWESLPDFLKERTDTKIPDPEPHLPGLTFGKFVSMLCAMHCVYTVSGPEELAEKAGFSDWTELPYSHADLWKMICSRTTHPGIMSGTAAVILDKISTGKYLNGPTPADRKMFREMNLPEWFEIYAASIFALASRSECVNLAIRQLEGTRLKIREEKERSRRI